MKALIIIGLVVLMSGCSTQRPLCPGALEPINKAAPDRVDRQRTESR